MEKGLLIKSYLKRLKLPTMGSLFERLAIEASNNNHGYMDYLLALVEQEVLKREENAIKQRIKRARFPVIKTLDSFDFSIIPSVPKQKILQLAQGEFVTRKENMIFLGNPGTGKTHLAIGIGYALCTLGKRVLFVTAAGIVNELMEANASLRLLKIQKQLQRMDLIIIDELGYVPFSREGAHLLFQLCSDLYERGSLIVTSNLDFTHWTEIFGDERLTGALLDRLTHRAHIFPITGESYRFRQSLSLKKQGVKED